MNLKKYAKILSVLLCTSILFIGCNNTKSDVSNNRLTIVTSFYPMYVSTLNIVKDIPDIELVNLTAPQTGCLHDYELSTKDMKILETADILVVNGAGMESFLDKVIAQYPDLDIITASEGIELIEDEDHNHDEEDHDHDAEEAHNHDEDHDHDHSVNPHVWVSISKNIEQVKNIADKLSSLDSKNSSKINENADEYINKLEDLSDNMHSELASITHKDIITFHEAFPYFAEEFNLNIVGVLEVEPDSEPSAKELENIINTVKEYNIKALFTEPQYSSKVAETVANETSAKIYTLDPIVTGEANENAADDYLNKMNQNLEVLKEALK